MDLPGVELQLARVITNIENNCEVKLLYYHIFVFYFIGSTKIKLNT